MANRPLYIPATTDNALVHTLPVEFVWSPGMSLAQKQKSIAALHTAAIDADLCKSPLEISSKSPVKLGVSLSAFNLTATTKKQRTFTVESAFQSSKVFENGGPYTELLYGASIEAKRDPRIRNSGNLTGFVFFRESWSLEPKTAFYDWLYINALHANQRAVKALAEYDAFTDIEFNPKKSINCQAYSVALYRSLQMRGLIQEAMSNKKAYLEIVSRAPPACIARQKGLS
ncbi:MAG: hypothetical protein MPJ22_08990 [Pirellulales bacterium]|nr:hypothetical protein [Alphaproteobacteria bacterium]MDA8042537.1 hypothetical protein [Pirellulales bacterium]